MKKINEIELASNLAHNATWEVFSNVLSCEDDLFESDGGDDDDCVVYKENIQDIFNKWYDFFISEIEKCVEN